MNENINAELKARMEFLGRLMHGARPGMPRCVGGRPGHAQERALRMIFEREGVSQRELMVRMNVRAGSLSELLSKLETRGLIQRRPDEGDRRLVRLYLTDAGRAQAGTLSDDPVDTLFASLSDAEKQSYLELTNKLIDALLVQLEEPPFGADAPLELSPFGRPPRDGEDMDRPPMDRPPFDRPPMDRPPHGRPPMDRPPHGRPPMDRPPFDRPPMDRPPHDRPPMDRPPFDRPPMDRPPHDCPPMEEERFQNPTV